MVVASELMADDHASLLAKLAVARAELKAMEREREAVEAHMEAANQRYADSLLKLDAITYKLDEAVAEAESRGRTIEALVADGILSADNARELQEFRATRRQ